MSDPKVPTGPGLWWRRDYAIPVKVTFAPSGIAPGLWWQRPDARGPSHVTDDGHWIAPVLTAEQASALTAERDSANQAARMYADRSLAAHERAERAERERDELRGLVSDARDIVDQYAPGFTIWLEAADATLTGSNHD